MSIRDLDIQTPSVLQPSGNNTHHGAEIPRLVVLLYEVEEEAFLAQRIAEVAGPRGLDVLLVGIAPETMQSARLRRQLATVGAFLRNQANSDLQVEIRVESGNQWLGRMPSILQPGDQLSCYSGQALPGMDRPLSDFLAAQLGVPVYAFSGLRNESQLRSSYTSEAIPWLVSLASIGGFVAVAARIVSSVQGWAQTVLLLICLLGETALLWLLNSLLGLSS